MRFNPKASADEGQIENRSGGSGSGFGLPIPSGGGGRLGAGGLVVVIVYVVFQLIAGNSVIPGTGDDSTTTSAEQCTGTMANQDLDCGIDLFTTSIQDYWSKALPEQRSIDYQPIVTVKYTGQTSSGCGTAQSAMGPFYCPTDKKVYIERSFMTDMLEGQLGAKGGPFALGYVVAHEYGHHIEDQLGILDRMRTRQGATSDSVKVELMADCLAGAWAKNASTTQDANGNVIIEDLTRDDVARAIDAAQAVGDDRIQQESGGRVDREAWTHGSSAERVHWFDIGMDRGTIAACDTFKAKSLD